MSNIKAVRTMASGMHGEAAGAVEFDACGPKSQAPCPTKYGLLASRGNSFALMLGRDCAALHLKLGMPQLHCIFHAFHILEREVFEHTASSDCANLSNFTCWQGDIALQVALADQARLERYSTVGVHVTIHVSSSFHSSTDVRLSFCRLKCKKMRHQFGYVRFANVQPQSCSAMFCRTNGCVAGCLFGSSAGMFFSGLGRFHAFHSLECEVLSIGRQMSAQTFQTSLAGRVISPCRLLLQTRHVWSVIRR